MKLLYADDGVYYAVYDKDWFGFTHGTLIPLSVFEIDEVEGNNKAVCADIQRVQMKHDAAGFKKYYIQNGELHSRDGWVEFVPPPPNFPSVPRPDL